MDCLKFWVLEYHVDGFRFDLASILTRAPSTWHPTQLDEDGNPVGLHSGGAAMDETGIMTDGAGVPTGTPLPDPPLIEAIAEDPVLRDTKLIAEAWDCDGLNQVAAFPHYGGRWAEWNGHFRDTVRNFIKGTDGTAGAFAAAMCGSPNIYSDPNPGESEWWSNHGGRKWRGNRPPTSSINFVIAHDGFTLADLVSYNEKHNEVNGEDNRDGEQHNNSWNSGEEGPTEDWTVKRLRQRQMRNISMALLLAHGVPMLHMGDEYGHTKNGNNNTYCHDTELNWFNWDRATADEAGLSRFHRLLIRLRKSRPELQRTSYVSDRDVQWHGETPFTPDWTETSRLVAYTLCNAGGEPVLMIAFNTAHLSKVLELPPLNGKVWQQVADTSKLAPYDFLRVDEVLSEDEVRRARAASLMWTADFKYPMLPWSSIMLEAVPESETHSLRA
ncbi:glycoside hydrolase superfamily [Dunaliella salina]|nr:glycoside hydrolase superfamily [Dunaliella salina]|eukprot:KAF5843397.1 glycoside hydrolase superfamily [Dunaliella salina]